jgi:hypothetical protein
MAANDKGSASGAFDNVPKLLCRCRNGCVWAVVVPPWWASWENIDCPTCHCPPYDFKLLTDSEAMRLQEYTPENLGD